MSALKDALKALKTAATESDEAADMSPPQALLQLSLIALRQLEASACESSDDANSEALAEAAKKARKELKQYRTSPSAGTKRPRAESPSDKKAVASASPCDDESSALQLGQYTTSDAFDNNERKKNKFARLLGGGKASAVTLPHNTVAASSSSVKEMNRVLETQYEDALKRGRKKGLGA